MDKDISVEPNSATFSAANKFVNLLTPYLHGKPEHMQQSGYEALVDFIPNSKVINCLDFRKLTKLSFPLRLAHILPQSYYSVDAELAALRSDGKVLHHLYGEDTLWLSLLARPRRSCPTVVTFHRPPHRLETDLPFFWKKKIRNLGGVIALAPNQRNYLRSICGGNTPVSLIPHGIDTDRYTPGDDLRSSDLLLSVGSYLRDFTTLAGAMSILANTAPELKLVLISKRRVPFSSSVQNIISVAEIEDEDLIRYYKKVSFVVLPFQSLVASNAMLESMAFGTPIVCPDSDAARFYLGDGIPSMYEAGNPNSLAEKILWLHKADRERRRLSCGLRNRAQQFSWPNVCRLILNFYDEILDSRY